MRSLKRSAKVWRVGLMVTVLQGVPALHAATENATASAQQAEEWKKLSLSDLMQIQVSTVSRVDERIDEAPGNIYVFTRETIQKRGYRSLGELLQVVPGFTVFHRDLQFVAGARGLSANDNAKISLLINGQNLNNIHEPDFLNGPINLDNVERVEVVVGPSSLFQQANTLAATVNVITKDVDGFDVMGAAGNNLPYSTTLMTGKHWAADKFLSFSFTLEEKLGFDAWKTRDNLAGRDLTGRLDWPSYFSVLKGQYGEWTAQAVAYRSTWPELNIYSGSSENHGVFIDQFYSAFVKNEHAWSANLTSVFRSDVTWKKTTRRNDDGPPINAVEQFLDQVVYSGELGLRYTGFRGHMIQAGTQFSYDQNLDNHYTWASGGTGPTTLFDRNTYALGFYADDTWKVSDRVKLVAGARIDHNTRLEGERWFPGARAALIVDPTKNWVTKLIYNRAVRIPNPLEAMNTAWGAGVPGSPPWATDSHPAQDPETLTTVEFQNIVYISQVRLCASLYHQELEDFTTWFSPHANGGNFRGNGVELSLQAPIDQHVTLWANGSLNDSKLDLFHPDLFGPGGEGNEAHHAYVNQQGQIVGSAGFTASGGCDFRLSEHLTFSPSIRYFTEQVGVDATQSKYIYLRNRAYLDATLRWEKCRLAKDVEADFTLSCRNLLDNRDPVGSPMNGHLYNPRGIDVVLGAEVRF